LSAFPAPFSNGFSSGKKYVPCILKYVRPISKYVGHIFSLLREGYNSLKMSFHFFLPESRHFRTVFPLLNPIRSLGFVKLRAYAWQIALRPAEGVAGYGEVGREDR
jgi:hypothetical protein